MNGPTDRALGHPLSREIEIEPAHTALLLVDVQNYNCTWEGGEYAHLEPAQKEERYGYFFRTLRDRASSILTSRASGFFETRSMNVS